MEGADFVPQAQLDAVRQTLESTMLELSAKDDELAELRVELENKRELEQASKVVRTRGGLKLCVC